jgi:phosphatidylserine synthase
MSDARSPKIYLLPNLMTAGNLFCGFAAVLRIYDGAQETDFLRAASDFHDAIWFILAACIFDLLDGRLARLGGHESPFGREFDSLADIVSFGMAPALLVYQIVLGEFRYGIAQSKHRSAYEAWLKSQLPSFDILAVTEGTTVAYAALRVALKRSGRPIPANDAWIAALAMQHRLPILSRDEHFDALSGVRRIGW